MSLQLSTLKAQIKSAFTTAMQNESGDADAVATQLANDIGDAVDDFVKSGTVSTSVTVTGVTPGPGSAVGTGTGSVS